MNANSVHRRSVTNHPNEEMCQVEITWRIEAQRESGARKRTAALKTPYRHWFGVKSWFGLQGHVEETATGNREAT